MNAMNRTGNSKVGIVIAIIMFVITIASITRNRATESETSEPSNPSMPSIPVRTTTPPSTKSGSGSRLNQIVAKIKAMDETDTEIADLLGQAILTNGWPAEVNNAALGVIKTKRDSVKSGERLIRTIRTNPQTYKDTSQWTELRTALSGLIESEATVATSPIIPTEIRRSISRSMELARDIIELTNPKNQEWE
jgi:hypothetical protein